MDTGGENDGRSPMMHRTHTPTSAETFGTVREHGRRPIGTAMERNPDKRTDPIPGLEPTSPWPSSAITGWLRAAP